MATAFGASIPSDRSGQWRQRLAVVLCSCLVGCTGATYSGPEWSARVVDMETGAPIENAIVVARWELERYSGRFAGWLFVAEAVTDRDGHFHFPAWGPSSAAPKEGMRTRMSPNVPDIAIFKPDYKVTQDSCCSDTSYLNAFWQYGSGEAARPSWANGKTFALEHFHGSLDAYRDYLDTNFSLAGPPCGFIATPKMFAAGVTENQRLIQSIARGVPHLSLKDLQEHRDSANCATTVRNAIERYLK